MITRDEIISATGFYFSHYDEYDSSEVYRSHKNKNHIINRYDDNFYINLCDNPGTRGGYFSTSSTGKSIKTVKELLIVIEYLMFLKNEKKDE